MASEHQVALTRSHRMPAPSSHISKAARQVVPAFLQKLYEMVNDPNNVELIRWSDAGDSFFVLDHERFAHEVLGRWFKHRNFSSFVRQLNMYGFHKIPHLQQGVLKSDTDTEFWNFAHANFRRGQPDLLCLIQRKKQMATAGDEGLIDGSTVGLLPGPSGAGGANATASVNTGNPVLSNGQVLDINSIVNGIAVIKRHQTTISAELNELKRSNQLLWQDALAARAKHQKQQDTINRIVKFLAGVFGNHATAGSPGSPSSPVTPGSQHAKDDLQSSVAPLVKRKMRLMIEDAKRDGPRKSMVEELTEMPMEIDSTSLFEAPNYPTIETPQSIPSPAPSDNISVADSSTTYFGNVPTPSTENASESKRPLSTSTSTSKSTSTSPPFIPQHVDTQHAAQHDHGKQISRAVTPTHPMQQSPPLFEFDTRLNGILNQLTPAQIQTLLASLASQTNFENFSDNGSPSTVNPTATTNSASGLLAPYHQPTSFDFGINPSSQSALNPSSFSMPEGLLSFDNYLPGSATNSNSSSQLTAPGASTSTSAVPAQQKLERQWQAAEDIDKDVNALNSSINSLVQAFGLDPSLLGEAAQHPQQHQDGSVPAQSGQAPEHDYAFFEELFNNMSTNGTNGMGVSTDLLRDNVGGESATGMDYSGMPSSGFMDDDGAANTATGTSAGAAVTDSAAPPVVQAMRHVSPGLGLSDDDNGIDALLSTGLNLENRKKRKSDVMSLAEGELPSSVAAALAADPQASAAKVAPAAAANPSMKTKRRKEK